MVGRCRVCGATAGCMGVGGRARGRAEDAVAARIRQRSSIAERPTHRLQSRTSPTMEALQGPVCGRRSTYTPSCGRRVFQISAPVCESTVADLGATDGRMVARSLGVIGACRSAAGVQGPNRAMAVRARDGVRGRCAVVNADGRRGDGVLGTRATMCANEQAWLGTMWRSGCTEKKTVKSCERHTHSQYTSPRARKLARFSTLWAGICPGHARDSRRG